MENLIGLPVVGGGEIQTRPVDTNEYERLIENATHFDWGYQAGREAVFLETQDAKREHRQRTAARYDAIYRKFRRRFVFDFLVISGVLFVALLAIAYLSRVN
jgi:hypothetical protein